MKNGDRILSAASGAHPRPRGLIVPVWLLRPVLGAGLDRLLFWRKSPE